MDEPITRQNLVFLVGNQITVGVHYIVDQLLFQMRFSAIGFDVVMDPERSRHKKWSFCYLFKCQLQKIVKHTRRNCLSVFYHLVGWHLKAWGFC